MMHKSLACSVGCELLGRPTLAKFRWPTVDVLKTSRFMQCPSGPYFEINCRMSPIFEERAANIASRAREARTGDSTRLSGCVRYARSIVLGACVVFGLLAPSRAEPLEEGRYHELVDICRKASQPIFLAEDKSFLCFDGDVLEDQDYSKVESLQPGGAFVVRSQGGYGFEALKIAVVLERKKLLPSSMTIACPLARAFSSSPWSGPT